jgi:LmbE family N-acetylglucosaminyl deacetylase
MIKNPRLMVIGAHPDDCDCYCGGLAVKYSRLGRAVQFVSVTDGSAGHQSLDRQTLAEIRKGEAKESAEAADINYLVLDYPDGRLEVNLETREAIIRLIRSFNPDIIITHRLNDYHPDHRYTSQLVQDASYLVMVPAICPDTPAIKRQSAIFFMSDTFEKPYPFTPSAIIGIDDVFGQKLKMVSSHRSQFFDWLPWLDSVQNALPEEYDTENYAFDFISCYDSRLANRFRQALTAKYGLQSGNTMRYAEAYELSEYGAPLSDDDWDVYFPL